jgi:outer membrane usher protein
MRSGLLLLLMVGGVALASQRSLAGGFVIADVLINGIVQNPAMILQQSDGSILARRADVTSWNLDVRNAPVETLQAIDHVRLSQLPGVRSHYDGATLTLDVAESAFQRSQIDLQKSVTQALDSGRGAYLNYDLSSFAGRGQRPVSGAALEAVVYADTLSVASNGVFSDTRVGRQFVRHETNLQWDFPDQLRSLVAGDTVSRSGALARAFRFGGISVGSNFATRPELVTFSLPSVPGESRIPTSAELLINGQTHSRFDLTPGPFEISNVPAINGAGEIQLLTRDPLGRQQVIVVPYYVTPALLRPGLTDAGFEAGRVREDFGIENFRYGRRFARAQLRRGITPGLTVDAFAEIGDRERVAGTGVTMGVGKVAVASAAIAIRDGNATGTSLFASLERSSRRFSFGLRGQYASRQFSQLGEIAGLHFRLNANAGVSLGSVGNVSVVHATESRYDLARKSTTAINYQKQLSKSLSLQSNFSIARTSDGVRNFAGLALIMPLDELASASLSSTRQGGTSEHMLDVRQNLPTNEGWGTRARLTARDGGNARVDAGLTLQTALGQWSVDASHASSSDNVRLGMNGSLVLVGGIPRAVRQLGDAFAIVSVPGYAGIDIFHENQKVARTDASGFAVIPRMRPFESNAVSLDTLKLSLSTELSDPQRRAKPARRAGALLQFKASETRGALLQIVTESGAPMPAGALISIGGETFMIASKGEAWVTGLSGETDAAVEWNGQRCGVHIVAPVGSKARPHIGPLTCKGVGA